MKHVSLELGSGGKMMRDFIAREIVGTLGNPLLDSMGDAVHLPENIAFTTDSYVVSPIFFPGGDIGTLSVFGTVNDLVVSGAHPLYLSLGLILEEGLPWDELQRVLRSIKQSADRADVAITTGDTKVVSRGQGDKIFINTAGIGKIIARPSPQSIRAGDKIILTGTLGEHSLAVMLARGDFGLESKAESDCAPLTFLLPFWEKGITWMRDVTRGGLATVMAELAESLDYSVILEEEDIPLSPAVIGAAELLGIDPLYLACEGRAAMVCPGETADQLTAELRNHPQGRDAAVIGCVDDKKGKPGEVLLRTVSGGLRLLEPLTSELLPRIC
jgi:hydrogenase expression/formation protein HypE